MNKTFGVLFYVRKTKTSASGKAPIVIRITIGTSRIDYSTKRYIEPGKWNAPAQKISGNTDETRAINNYLKKLEQNVYHAYALMTDKRIPFTPENFKKYLTGEEDKRMLVAIFRQHNERAKALAGKEFSPATCQRYETSLKHTIEFMMWKYKQPDIDVRNIDHDFITSYDFYFRSVRKCNNNSTVKYLKNFKKIIRICIANGWIDKDPFLRYKPKLQEVVKEVLASHEIKLISEKEFSCERLNSVKNIFLFCCYTGLAYADIRKLKRSEIQQGVDNTLWVLTKRQKTAIPSRIPLLPPALSIIKKYENNPQCVAKDVLLPVPCNQKMNAYLKEIADLCGIAKNLTTHSARHTFATTVTLSNGVPIETVSKMLGHTNIRTTQQYAKILDMKISADMKQLVTKLTY